MLLYFEHIQNFGVHINQLVLIKNPNAGSILHDKPPLLNLYAQLKPIVRDVVRLTFVSLEKWWWNGNQ